MRILEQEMSFGAVFFLFSGIIPQMKDLDSSAKFREKNNN